MYARMVGDRRTFDEFERDVGDALVGHAAFDEPRDARMRQLREGEALAQELAARVGRVQRAMQDLERDDLAHALAVAARAEHGGRAAFAECVYDLERADAAADGKRRRLDRTDRARGGGRAAGEKFVVARVGLQQALEALAQRHVDVVGVEVGAAIGAGEPRAGIE
ncbi:MAG: hypothetical protein NVV68_18305 [Dokdonella sp.]|nr:hypothetical protein [Dokdonella sp.]